MFVMAASGALRRAGVRYRKPYQTRHTEFAINPTDHCTLEESSLSACIRHIQFAQSHEEIGSHDLAATANGYDAYI
jgi:hypothetical protein